MKDLEFQKKLTIKQKIFISEYLIHRNATKAATLAGYSPKTARSAGSRLLTNVDISLAIKNGIEKQVKAAEITAQEIIQGLKSVAFSDLIIGSAGKLRALELLGQSVGLFQKMKNATDRQPAAYLLVPDHSRK